MSESNTASLPVFMFARVDKDGNLVDMQGALLDRAACENVPKWSNPKRPPAIGARVNIRINSIGAGVVTGYRVIHGWLGLHVRPENPPQWWKDQARQGNYSECWVTGIETEY